MNFHIFSLDEQTKKPQKSPTPSQLHVETCEATDELDPVGNQESIVKIMVESPKEPPNVEFGVAFPQTAVVRIKTESTQEIEQTDGQSSSTSVTLVTDIQEPIDVNIPRDTTNIFYAYEETEVDNSFQLPQQSQKSLGSQNASTPEIQDPKDTSDTSDISHNQSVNIEHDDTVPSPESSESDHQSTNQISSDKSRSSS